MFISRCVIAEQIIKKSEDTKEVILIRKEKKQPAQWTEENNVWIGGDFNFSDISWPSGNITSSNHTKKLNRSFLDTFKDCLLEQIVNFPTRKTRL